MSHREPIAIASQDCPPTKPDEIVHKRSFSAQGPMTAVRATTPLLSSFDCLNSKSRLSLSKQLPIGRLAIQSLL